MKVVEKPNALIIVAIAALVAKLVFESGLIHNMAVAVAVMAWSAWGYDELAHGRNAIRKALGAVVLIIVFLDILRSI